jgi:hypothetical protein
MHFTAHRLLQFTLQANQQSTTSQSNHQSIDQLLSNLKPSSPSHNKTPPNPIQFKLHSRKFPHFPRQASLQSTAINLNYAISIASPFIKPSGKLP